MSLTSSPQVSSGQSSMELPPLASTPVLEKKVAAYVEVVKNLNNARERGFPFKTRNVTRLVAPVIVAGLGALTHALGTLVPVIGASGFVTAATTIGTVVGSFR